MITRRKFIKQSASALATGLIVPQALRAGNFLAPSMAPSDQINVALIGCKSMGWADLSDIMNHKGLNCVALCDVDQNILQNRAADAEKAWGRKPELYTDYRKVLERKDIDAVIIGTPDHWHCLMMTDACAAGKDVYVEKPIANTIAECDAMTAAVQRYSRVIQVGQQQRSSELWRSMKQYVDSGQLGKIARVNIWANFAYAAILPRVADKPVPQGVDYDMWLGPAPQRPFNEKRFHGLWRMFWDYGGGLMTDWGVHLLDMGLWGMNVKGMPRRVVALGGNLAYPNNFSETFDTLKVLYEFPDFIMQWSNSALQSGPYDRNYGVEFKGQNGTLVANRESWEVIPNGNKLEAVKKTPTNNEHYDHTTNFIESIRNRNLATACPITNGSICAKYAHMGNIAARPKESLTYDEAHQTFHNKQADKLITPTYRKPWKMYKD
ncbi:MAG: Gfo/Idh/MocA family oxidoreductase [Bacteroidaceae bacterium]|nr:Gfo/Idh/MocA family oxidoreductase [Bacteroidaceae bacterium]